MTIRDLQKYVDNIWDWTFLDACFEPTRIKITDLDGVVERKGHFLLIETKLPDVEIAKGQRILFDALKNTGQWHIVVIWGQRNQPQQVQIWGGDKHPVTQQAIQRWVKQWFRWADNTTI